MPNASPLHQCSARRFAAAADLERATVPPDRALADLALGFAVVNIVLVSFGVWCYLARVRSRHSSGRSWAWFWTVLEAANGMGHLILAASRGGYFPGVATAPLLLGFSVSLGLTLPQADESERV